MYARLARRTRRMVRRTFRRRSVRRTLMPAEPAQQYAFRRLSSYAFRRLLLLYMVCVSVKRGLLHGKRDLLHGKRGLQASAFIYGMRLVFIYIVCVQKASASIHVCLYIHLSIYRVQYVFRRTARYIQIDRQIDIQIYIYKSRTARYLQIYRCIRSCPLSLHSSMCFGVVLSHVHAALAYGNPPIYAYMLRVIYCI